MVYLLKPPFKMVDLSMAMSVSHNQMVNHSTSLVGRIPSAAPHPRKAADRRREGWHRSWRGREGWPGWWDLSSKELDVEKKVLYKLRSNRTTN
jgi:hypothetical protein